jgi:hypothetical protein
VAENEQLPVPQARAGDPAAWDALFRRYQLPLYAYIFELVRDEQTSLDLAQVNFNRAFEEFILDGFEPQNGRILPSRVEQLNLELQELPRDRGTVRGVLKHRILAGMLLPAMTGSAKRSLMAQNTVIQAILACALERHRLAEREYPTELNALVPRFISALPHDPITAEPPIYRRTGDTFLLYSVGWNESDEDGQVMFRISGRPETGVIWGDEGDWVWPSAPLDSP